MALQFNELNDSLVSDDSLGVSAFSASFWFYQDSRLDYATPISFASGTANYLYMQTSAGAAANQMAVGKYGGESNVGPVFSLNTWYWVGWTKSGESNTVWILPQTAAYANSTVTVSETGTYVMRIAESPWGGSEWWNGRIAAVKVWDTGLSQAEMEAERWTYAPQRKSNLWYWSPLFGQAATHQNYAGGANDLTENTAGSATADGPPIIWDYQPALWMPESAPGGVPSLVIASLAQAQALGAAGLTQHHAIAPSPMDQAQSLGGAVLTQRHTIAMAGAAQSQSLDATSLTAHAVLAAAELAQAQTLDLAALTQHHAIAPAESSQAQTSDQVTLTAQGSLSVAALQQLQTLGTVQIVQRHAIAPSESAQSQTVDTAGLTAHAALSPAESAQSQQVDNATLAQHHALSPAPTDQVQSIGPATLTQLHALGPAPLDQAQSLATTTLIVAGTLPIAALYHGQYTDTVTLSQHYAISPQAIDQAQALDTVVLLAHASLAPAPLDQAQTLDTATLAVGALTLAVVSLSQAQDLDAAVLTGHHVLVVDDSVQQQLLSGVTFGGAVGWLAGEIVIVSSLGGRVSITPAIDGVVTLN